MAKAIIDLLLSNVSQKLQVQGCVAEILLPKLPVAQSSGKLAGYGTSHLRIVHSTVSGRSEFRRVNATTRTTTDFSIESHGLEGLVTPEDVRNYPQPFDAESDETEAVTGMLQLEKELAVATVLGNTSVHTQNVTLSGSSQLSDFAGSDPLDVISDARKAVKAGCGMAPDTVVLDWNVAEVLRVHPKLLDYLGFKYNRPGGITNEEFARVFGVKKVLIPECVYETAAEGASSSLSPIWGKNIVFAVSPDAPKKNQVALGYHLQLGEARKVWKAPIHNPPDSTSIIVKDEYDQLLTNVGAAFLVKNAIA